MDIDAYFRSVEASLLNELELIRASFAHAGNKGASLEASLRTLLRKHLPRKLDVGHGELIGHHGQSVGRTAAGGQIDVIGIDDSHPIFFDIETPCPYFWEGVRFCGEVKAQLKLSDVAEVFSKAADIKKMRYPLPAGDMSYGNKYDMARFLEQKPFFLFAYESRPSLDAIIERIAKCESEAGLKAEEHIDAVFVLGNGSVWNLGNGQGSVSAQLPNGSRVGGWMEGPPGVIASLLTWLTAVLPGLLHMNNSALINQLVATYCGGVAPRVLPTFTSQS